MISWQHGLEGGLIREHPEVLRILKELSSTIYRVDPSRYDPVALAKWVLEDESHNPDAL